MLSSLIIQNYAIIDEIEISFSPNLNIITGETGAGKSIVIGALSLILGERADTSVLLQPGKKCFIEGVFKIERRNNVLDFLTANDLHNDADEVVLRREIAANGKSRAFINDTPASLQQLKILASLLVDLHQQFDTLELGDSDFQREVVDALAKNAAALSNYKHVFHLWQSASKELEQLQLQKNNFNKEFDYHQFLFNELAEINLQENELELLDEELKIQSNAENIKTKLSQVYYQLKETEQPVVQSIKQLMQQLQSIAAYHKNIPSIVERLQSAYIELNDVADETESINNTIQFDEQRIAYINERILSGYKLLKKHGVQTTAELLIIQNELEEKLLQVLHIDEAISSKEKETKLLYQKAIDMAEELSARRKKITPAFEKNVNELLVQVGMPNARIKVSINQIALKEYGKDEIEFLFDANLPAAQAGNSNRLQPLRKIASGGELSRLMLCIKSLVAESINLPTLIFDEIDTGISGEAARQVGVIMKTLSAKRQVISITHQPQIAGRANAHFFVFKEIKNNSVITGIRKLSQEERITIIAQMLSGEKPTAAALQNAREMVMN